MFVFIILLIKEEEQMMYVCMYRMIHIHTYSKNKEKF